jgi:hypothetical protein
MKRAFEIGVEQCPSRGHLKRMTFVVIKAMTARKRLPRFE